VAENPSIGTLALLPTGLAPVEANVEPTGLAPVEANVE